MTQTYATGETPRVGDRVKSAHNQQATYKVLTVGDLLTFDLDTFGGAPRTGRTRDLGSRGAAGDPAIFSLLSRGPEVYATGEPVQIGDVLIPLPGFNISTDSNKNLSSREADTVARLDCLGRPVLVHDSYKRVGWPDVAERFALVKRAEPAPAPEAKAAPAIDIATIKAGDFVTVRLKVTAAVDGDGDLEVSRSVDGYANIYLPASFVIGHEPTAVPEKPLAVGDRVRHKNAPHTVAREIVAIANGHAWTKREDRGGFSTQLLDQLERVS